MTCKHILKYERGCDASYSCIGSLYCNAAFRIWAAAADDDDDDVDDDDDGVEISSPILLLSLRSVLRRLLRYVNVDCVELKWFVECVWLLIML